VSEQLLSGAHQVVASFNYKTGGQLESILFANGAKTSMSYDSRSRFSQLQTKNSSGTVIFHQGYTYDVLINITGISDPYAGITQSFTYDQLSRLRTATYNDQANPSQNYSYIYGYNGSDNRTIFRNTADGTIVRYTYHSNNGQLLTGITQGTQTETLGYNQAGAMVSRLKAGVTTSYSYDGAGRLKEVKIGGNTIAKYEYDAYGRLIRTTEGSKVTIRLPLGTETAYEKVTQQGSPTVERRYILALGRYIARDEVIGGVTYRTYYHGDHLGSTRLLTGDDSGTFIYDPFGSVVQATGDAPDHNHRFTGKPVDSTGLYYYGARFYDPVIGRFISMDPARDGLNWYVYCENNPVRYVDPTGMWGRDIHYGAKDEEGNVWGTFFWAIDLGFSDMEAHIIADANYGVDFGLFSNPILPVAGQKYHFNTNPDGIDSRKLVAEQHLNQAISLYVQAQEIKIKSRRFGVIGVGSPKDMITASILETLALKHLGQGLHAIQDMYAHTDKYVYEVNILGVTIYHHLGPKGKEADTSGFPESPNERALKAESETRDYLTRFRMGVGLQ